MTERARKLRAQYALQAQGLRARLEMRVNRIPQALRKRNLGELLEEHAPKPALPPPSAIVVVPAPSAERRQTLVHSAKKGTKRQRYAVLAPDRALHFKTDPSSDFISAATADENDKENAPAPQEPLPNPKKRVKTATANTKASRNKLLPPAPSNVLSPRSHNSQTLPRSPFKSIANNYSPEKGIPRPVFSPFKARPSVAVPASRAPSRQVKRVEPTSDETRQSGGSDSSAGTTIVRKEPGGKKAVAGKKTAAVGKAAPKKVAKKENEVPAPAAVAAGGRTLRKRN